MTATCHLSGHERYCQLLADEMARLVGVAERSDRSARVPTCTDWTVADLLDHVGTVHRWAGSHVRVLAPERRPLTKDDFPSPADPAGYPEWLAEGGRELVATLREADPDAPMWAWGSDRHARFWSRRMLHETTVHGADASFAIGAEPAVDAEVAVDGVDEFLDNLPFAARWAPKVNDLRGDGETIALRCDEASWRIRLERDRFTWAHADGDATATVDAPAADLYLFVWGRRKLDATERIKTGGDQGLIAAWIERSAI